ncbi:MAG TPA: VCBS repeat-containing protein [Vicinamibacteria bacterium]|nr:VCBS repeat-containing protein [Vicinamibacteria bacterium]
MGLAAAALAAGGLAATHADPAPPLAWASKSRYRLLLDVDPRGVRRSHSVAAVDVDFRAELAARGASGAVDESTIEAVAYDAAGRPRPYDPGRAPEERILVPWHLDRFYPLDRATLSFVVPDERATRFAVYFDTAERARPPRYPGIVGDGDLFTEGWGRREIAPNASDTFVDLDGDGDLDLVKGGTEPFLYVYENRGQGRFVDRGRLTSAGEVMTFPHDDANRSWLSVEFADWDGDGDPDMFVSFRAGPYENRVVRYENVTVHGGPLTFAERGPMTTVSGVPLTGRVSFVDWDGDGRLDVLTDADDTVTLHRNVGTSRAVADMALADGVWVEANGTPIRLTNPRLDAADIDGDGDLDLFAGTEDGRVYLFRNAGTRRAPVLEGGRLLAFYDYMDAKTGIKVADFDGDGLLDFVVGRFWERSHYGDQPRVFGRLYHNVGTRTAPRFEARDASGGAPYTERFQPADALRQNGVRAVDWDEDGRLDLVAGDSDGFVWLFRNTTDALAPIFAPGVRLLAAGRPLRVYGEEPEARAAGYARVDVTDWNEDGRKDLVVADGRGWLWLFLNRGTKAAPVLGPGRRLTANGHPIDGTSRGSVLVRDWDGDGRKDVLFAMVGEGPSATYDWPPRLPDRTLERGFLYYRNFGTNAAPELGAPKWIKAGPDAVEIDLLRPNLGDFVDWDGDGKKDFIACEFELDCRLFRNTSAGGPGKRPRFDSSAEGIVILKPWTGEMISGVDARDWNGDGDIDLLTGQGHGGSGLRFFERDYLEDLLHGTLPGVRIDRAADTVTSP